MVASSSISLGSLKVMGRSPDPPVQASCGCLGGQAWPSSRGMATNDAVHSWAKARVERMDRTVTRRAPQQTLPTAERSVMRQLKDAGFNRYWRNAQPILKNALTSADVDPLRVSNAVMSAFIKSGRWHKALDLLDEMRAKGVTPDMVSYNTIMRAYGEGKQWEKALGLLDEMETKDVTPNVISWNTAMKACGDGG